MADVGRLRADAEPLRRAVTAAEAELVRFDVDTAALEDEAARAGARLDPAARAERRAGLLAARAEARSALHQRLRATIEAAEPDELAAALDPGVPLLLLPVRLETRLRPDGGRPTELLVRIFPDDIHVDAHEPELTAGETDAGRRYWTLVWRAGWNENASGDRARLLTAAWDGLTGALGPERGRWVAEQLTPTVDNRPDQPLGDDQPAPPISFPAAVARRGRAWTRAAATSTLPDRFVALAYQGDRLVGSAPGATVPDVVPVGPDPDARPPTGDGAMPLDPELRWLVEFDQAAAIGMAIRVPLDRPGYDPARRPLLTGVAVVGVAASLDAGAAAARVRQLLTSQQHTRGLGFIAQDTPTNNLADTRQAPAAAPDPDALLHGRPPADPLANANLVAKALGVPATGLVTLPGAADTEQADARALQLALWTATGDFFADQLMEEDSRTREALSSADRAWLRSHYADHVRARGPLPVLRVGRQPYGLLPATSFTTWRRDPSSEPGALAGLHATLRALRPFWDVGVPTLPRIGGPDQPGEDLDLPKPERDVLRALGIAPVSRAVYVRAVRGALNACYTNVLTGLERTCGDTLEDRLTSTLHRALGLDYQPVISHHQNETPATRLWLPLVRPLDQTGADAVEALALTFQVAVTRVDAKRLVVGPGDARTLLEALLRHVANLEYGYAAVQVASHHGVLDVMAKLRHPEPLLVHTDPPALAAFTDLTGVSIRALTAGRALAVPIPTAADAAGGDATAADAETAPAEARELTAFGVLQRDHAPLRPAIVDAARLHSGVLKLIAGPRPWSVRLAEIDAALEYLALRVRAWGEHAFPAIERLLGECLDLVSHRLDAWYTSLATARLVAMRERRPEGVQLGAYGWIEDLSPREGQRRSDGSIMAPSLAQATTAAVLRSGALSHPADDRTFAVDLSSRRMRVAMAVLDGVRAGQPIGALLGYRLERRLHEAREGDPPLELDRVIAPLRRIAPLLGALHDGPGAQEFIAAHDVVDGARLAGRPVAEVLTQLDAALAAGPAPRPLQPGERDAVRERLEALRHDVDAVADLLLAESVHQLANGNPSRAGATVETLAAGGNPPPRPELLDTPRPATPVTHRVLVAVPASASPAAGWDSPRRRGRPRATAEPRIDVWAGHLLGPVERIRVRVSWRVAGARDAAPERVTEHAWPLEDECALDVLALAAAGALTGAVLARLAERPPADVPAGAVPAPAEPARGPGWQRSLVSLDELGAIASAAAATLAAARPAVLATFAPAAVPPPDDAGADLLRRARDALSALRAAASAAGDALADATTSPVTLRERLAALRPFGVGPPVADPALDAAALRAALADATGTAADRVRAAAEHLGSDGPSASASAAAAADALEAVFGPGFRAADLITPSGAAALIASFGPGLRRGDPGLDPVRTWLERAATVRPAVATLADALLYSEAAGTGRGCILQAGQTPFAAGDHWVGADGWPRGAAPAAGLVVHGPAAGGAVDLNGPVAAVVVDAWSELIPTAMQTAGASFHFDAPGARPPNAVLVAVPPVPGAPWSVNTVAAVVRETFQLAKLRLVDLEALGWLGRYLPAGYVADGVLGTVAGVDFKGVLKDLQSGGRLAKFMRAES
jgi:hypothetical protein